MAVTRKPLKSFVPIPPVVSSQCGLFRLPKSSRLNSPLKFRMHPRSRFVVLFVLLAAWTRCLGENLPGVHHFLVIGCDGMSPDGIEHARTPIMHGLMARGSYSLHARAVMPTVSSPNWASMIMGAGPEQHGITSNEWETNKFEIAPIVSGSGGMFPTIFGVLRDQKPTAYQAVFHDWDGFGRLFERATVNQIEHPEGPTNTMDRAVACLREHHPEFTFVHLDHVDHAGHTFGWKSPEYYTAVEVADKLIGQALETLKEAGMGEDTVVLVTADHGGKGTHHGGFTMEEIEIPWILAGPGVQKGHALKTFVNTYDTAATVAYTLGLKTPDAWIARPVVEAFGGGK